MLARAVLAGHVRRSAPWCRGRCSRGLCSASRSGGRGNDWVVAMSETDLVKLFSYEAVRRDPSLRIFRRNIVAARTAAGTFVRAGIKGQADVYGFLSGSPAVPFELEAKAHAGRPTEEQIAWANFCRRMGIPHLFLRAHKGERPTATVNRWIDELQTLLAPYRTTPARTTVRDIA